MTNKPYPFRNLAFQGGGVKTLAYQGAMAVLEARGVLPQIERVAGTSAGALVAMLLSFRLGAEKTSELFNTIDFARIPALRSVKDLNWQPPKLVEPQLDRLINNLDGVKRLLYQFGWHANEVGYTWLQDTIADQCHGNGRATFADFQACGFRDLHVVVTNLSSRSMEVFNAENTPDVAVADALLMSQSIPLFFESVRFDGHNLGSGDFYGDGGLLNNFPIHVFDRPPFALGNEWFVNGINWQTLGLRLFTPKDCPRTHRPITNLLTYMASLMEAMFDAQDVIIESNQADRWRSIHISNCCVSLTDFTIHADTDDDKFQQLVNSGRAATEAFLDAYQPPTLDQLKKWRRIISNLWPLG